MKDPMAAGATLSATLEAENAALAALDLPRAAALVADKQRAIADLAAAEAPAANPAAERMARRLRALALENKRLLERAIAAQGRVIGIVAQAAAATPDGYGGQRRQRPPPVALSARA